MLVLQLIPVPRRHRQLKYNLCFTSSVAYFHLVRLFLGTSVPHKNVYLAPADAPLWYAAGFWEFSVSCGGKGPVKSKPSSVSVPPFSGSLFTHAKILTH